MSDGVKAPGPLARVMSGRASGVDDSELDRVVGTSFVSWTAGIAVRASGRLRAGLTGDRGTPNRALNEVAAWWAALSADNGGGS